MGQLIKNKQITVTSPFDFNNQRLSNLGEPTIYSDAVTKNYVDTNAINYALGTGLYSGCVVTIVDGTHFSISSGVGYIVDPISKHINELIISEKTNVSIMTVGATDITISLAIAANNTVFQQIPIFNATQRRNYIILGQLFIDPVSRQLTKIFYQPVFSWDSSSNVDFEFEKEIETISGNSISANGANLMLNVSSGVMKGYSINSQNSFSSPNYSSFTGETSFYFTPCRHNGIEWIYTGDTNQLEPQYWSNGTANLQSSSNNKWNIRLFFRGSISSHMYMAYPTQQHEYTDADSAIGDLKNLKITIPDELIYWVAPCAFVIVRGAATNLNITTDAVIVPIQSMSVVAGGSTTILALDVSYSGSGTTNLTSTNVEGALSEINNKVENIDFSANNQNMIANSGTTGSNYLATNNSVFDIPRSRIKVYINDLEVNVGNGVKTADCYFSNDNGITAKNFADIAQGDYLYWSSLTYDLDSSDKISYEYLVY